jgi:hypothetical protein
VVIEITSRQKALDVDIGMRLLENLLGDLLRPNAADAQRVVLQQRILLVKLVALNLWDVPLHLKPLYESVDRQLSDESLRQELRNAAKSVARKQAFRLASSGGFDISSAVLEVGEEKEFAEIALGAGQLNIVLHEVKEDNALISLIFAEEFGRKEFGPFNVSYFDAPLTDNAKHSSVRVAAILLSTSPSEGKAEFRVLVFDDDLATDRIDIQELTRELKSRGTAAGSPPSK